MPDPAPIEFETALAEIERIVNALEQGGPDLNAALAGYGRGISLLTACQGLLDNAERSVALLTGVDDAGEPIVSPFDASATATNAPPVEPLAVATPPAPTRKARSTPGKPDPVPTTPTIPAATPNTDPYLPGTTPEAPF